ncbi:MULTISPECIES: ABC-type transport auxiliary lipoprotein family protein [Simplicispira]|jgi:cholesterol transport system auxiliary component|uniref:Cholesterol transport system auxiliary component n=1 Tax=Simplicispira metamorpha TaxID=80881 RepID=A0A4R2N6U5_9BURK|nr:MULTISPECIES: ABC-type transport auxiliary lipoprotein family protein [Simplicispira]MDD2692036.1 ABC-type transport auxiliary lipoprotein family protein [Simplicispira sp.]TCP16581.1 cholesterol transport system auxiliary component [Simplicispira metamorpha]
MNALKKIAASARPASVVATFAAIFLAGCSALPQPPVRPVLYDLGPGQLAPAAEQPPLPALALADVQSAGPVDGSTAVHYRLAYADARQLRPYQSARWSQPPAQLLEQRLRAVLGERRAVLRADKALIAARQGQAPTAVLRVELEEFSQIFTSEQGSTGVVRLRATLVEPTPTGEQLLGQRLFVAQQAATSADAAGGTRALAEATQQAAQALAQWLEQQGR